MANLEAANLRYIVFMIDSNKEHDGKIFCNPTDAQEYAIDAIKDNYCDKAVIGFFYMEAHAEKMNITAVQTFGFRNDKKPSEQLKLF